MPNLQPCMRKKATFPGFESQRFLFFVRLYVAPFPEAFEKAPALRVPALPFFLSSKARKLLRVDKGSLPLCGSHALPFLFPLPFFPTLHSTIGLTNEKGVRTFSSITTFKYKLILIFQEVIASDRIIIRFW